MSIKDCCVKSRPCGKCVADNLQRREYAKAALVGYLASTERPPDDAGLAKWAFDTADAMLNEQHHREDGE